MKLKFYIVCYGNFGLVNYLQLLCLGDQKIIVMVVYVLVKNKFIGCFQQYIGFIDFFCCLYDVKDCFVLYNFGLYWNYYEKCNGKFFCQIFVLWIDIFFYCNSFVYIERINYMRMDYNCILGIFKFIFLIDQ